METKELIYLADRKKHTGIFKPGNINIYASMPCPMKIPFKQLMTAFIEEYNVSHKMPIYCPDVADCSSEELGFLLQTTRNPDCLPDIIIVNNYEFFFAFPFTEHFLQTGIYQGVVNPSDLKALPVSLRENFIRSNLGVLCFGSRSIVQDSTVTGFPQTVTSWRKLLTPAWEDQFTVHGHLDKATFGFMYFLHNHFGPEGIARYARNIGDIKHFSQIIKRMCTNEYRTAMNILPDVAASKIPSVKKVKIIHPEEGKILSPMILLVKSSGLERCRKTLEFFRSRPFRSMLSRGCILPDELEKGTPYFMPDFETLTNHYRRMEKEFNDLYLNNLNMEKILQRQTEGGICKG
jgi:hypothetical protein